MRPCRSSHGSEIRPAAVASPRLTTTRACGDSSRQAHATRFRHDSLPGQPPVSASCQLPCAERAARDRRQQTAVERPQVLVGRLVGPAAEEDRQAHLATLELTLVDEPRAGLRERRHGGDAGAVGRKRGRRARLVVVLEKPHEAPLVAGVGGQVAADLVGALAREAVVEPLVVAGVEALLLERPLEIPVGLGEEEEAGMRLTDGRDHRRPVFLVRRRADARAPRPLEDVVQHEHRHVAAHAVALLRDLEQRRDGRRRATRRRTRPAARRRARPGSRDRGRSPGLPLSPPHEVLGVLGRPGVIRRDVVRDEVEDQSQAALGEGRARGGEPGRAAEVGVDDVPADAVRRADDVLRHVVGQRLAERGDEAVVLERDRDPGRAALPHPHQPDGVEAELGDRVPLGRRDVAERDRPARARAQLAQPHPRVELVDERGDAVPRARGRRPLRPR